LLFRVLWPLCAGRPFVRRQLAFPEDLQRASREHPAFAWVASPALLKRMGDNLDWPALSRCAGCFPPAAHCPQTPPQSLQQRLQQWPTEILGSSETGGIAWRQGASLWQPFADVELSQDSDGALLIASPYLPAGHVEHTADAARIAADGRFELLGRLDRIVKLEEKRISLPMLEQALIAHPGSPKHGWAWFRKTAPSSAPCWCSATKACMPCATGPPHLTEALRQHLSQHCEALALPRRWRLLRQLPLNSQGKLPQADVEALLLAPRPKAPEVLEQVETDGEWSLQLSVPPDLAYFSGHFPSPGVARRGAGRMGAEPRPATAEPAGKFAGMEVLKFQQLVRPGDEVQLHLRFDPSAASSLAYRNGVAACSSGRILLEPAMHNPCAVIPVYNHETAVGTVVDALLASGLPCILVDDASSPSCARCWMRWPSATCAPGAPALNQGKGGAVMTGLREARVWASATPCKWTPMASTTCTTSRVYRIPRPPDAMICGYPLYDESVPKGRLYARYLTHVMVWINTLSLQIRDSMCGFRVYPLPPTLALIDSAHRQAHGFRLRHPGAPGLAQPADALAADQVHYPLDGVSHFRLFHDNALISACTPGCSSACCCAPVILWRRWHMSDRQQTLGRPRRARQLSG
jgi:3-hydroxymyristoyl/3-hydroxydecanoyl-(acyl carrier protein) dehydratase